MGTAYQQHDNKIEMEGRRRGYYSSIGITTTIFPRLHIPARAYTGRGLMRGRQCIDEYEGVRGTVARSVLVQHNNQMVATQN